MADKRPKSQRIGRSPSLAIRGNLFPDVLGEATVAHDFMAALEAEIADLETELSADVRFVRLNHLRKTHALYVDPDAVVAEMRASGANVISPGRVRGSSFASTQAATAIAHAVARVGRKRSADKTQALEIVEMHLNNRSGPVPTRDLLEHLQDLGVEVGGASPLNNLSAMLSNSQKFQTHGRLGWTLADSDASDFEKPDENSENDLDYQDIFTRCSDIYLGTLPVDVLKEIINHMEFNTELPDYVKIGLTQEFEKIVGHDYEPGKPGGFQGVFIKQLKSWIEILGV